MQSFHVFILVSAVIGVCLLTHIHASGMLMTSEHCDEDFAYCTESNQCIASTWVCDHDADCYNGEDEQNCEYRCGADEFQCADDSCIYGTWACDGEPDCEDDSDEHNCPVTQSST